jgi:nucleotide-binding universal stress UspA family protein
MLLHATLIQASAKIVIQIDLVVLSTHGRTGAQRPVLGSVAEESFRIRR